MPGSLIVSNPPHAEPDYDAAAQLLELTMADVRMKSSFPAPEVWEVLADRAAAEQRAEAFRSAGIQVTIVDADRVAAIPFQALAKEFAFEDDTLRLTTADEEFRMAYDDIVTVVYCKPPKDFVERRAPRRRLADTVGKRSTSVLLDGTVAHDRRRPYWGLPDDLERATFADIYAEADDGVLRVTITSNYTGFSGLGEQAMPSAEINVAKSLTVLAERAPSVRIDRRLENVRPRARLTMGHTVQEGRKLLSFGTVALNELLDEVEPDLHKITQFELGSRLAYLMEVAG